MIEAFVLGWFAMAALLAACREPDAHPAPMCARPHVAVGAFKRGSPFGCDYRDPYAHLAHYPPGAVHLCNDLCVHEPPEER